LADAARSLVWATMPNTDSNFYFICDDAVHEMDGSNMTPDEIAKQRKIIAEAICIGPYDQPGADFVSAALTGWPAALDEIERLKSELDAACEHVERICEERNKLRAEFEEVEADRNRWHVECMAQNRENEMLRVVAEAAKRFETAYFRYFLAINDRTKRELDDSQHALQKALGRKENDSR
jgi:hypothetical protein